LLLLEGGDAADGEAVAPVEVGHGERVADDAGEMGDVADLLDRLVGLLRLHELARGIDAPGDAHGARLRDLVEVGLDLLQVIHDQTISTQRHKDHKGRTGNSYGSSEESTCDCDSTVEKVH